MIVISYVDAIDGSIFKKTRLVLSTDWPIQIKETMVDSEQELRIMFHRLGIKDWRVEDIVPQDYAERKVESRAYALASEIVFYGYNHVEVQKESSGIFLRFITPNREYHSLKIDLKGYIDHSGIDLPTRVEELLSQYYAEID